MTSLILRLLLRGGKSRATELRKSVPTVLMADNQSDGKRVLIVSAISSQRFECPPSMVHETNTVLRTFLARHFSGQRSFPIENWASVYSRWAMSEA